MTTLLDNDQIREKIDLILDNFAKELKPKPKDEVVVRSVADLVANLLQNINDIARAATQRERRDDPNRG